MTYSKSSSYTIRMVILIVLWSIIGSQFVISARGIEKERILLLYDRRSYYGCGGDIPMSMELAMGAFDVEKVIVKQIDRYKKDEIKEFTKVFIFSTEASKLKDNLRRDLLSYSGTICWIGNGIENILGEYRDVSVGGYCRDIVKLYYTSKRAGTIEKENMDKYTLQSSNILPYVNILGPTAKVYGYASDGLRYYPYIVNCKNLWFISRVDEKKNYFYIFCDILNDIFKKEVHIKGKIFVRIEDVHPFRDINELKNIADFLYEENIPYMIALVSAYKNTEMGYITLMSERKEFIKTIQYMQERGGTVVLKGLIHEGEIEALVTDSVKQDVEECVKNGIYPLAFEAPHYVLEEKGYIELKKYFSTYVGHFKYNNKRFVTTEFPLEIRNTVFFKHFIPENLGYINTNSTEAVEKIKANYSLVSKVRGYSGGFRFHPSINIKYLKEVVSFFQEEGVAYMDLKKGKNIVEVGNIKIWSKDGKIYREGSLAKTSEVVPKKTNIIGSINTILIVIISIFAVIFIVIFLLFKNIDKNKHLR